MTRRPLVGLLPLLVAVGVALAGCSGDDPPPDDPTPSATPSPSATPTPTPPPTAEPVPEPAVDACYDLDFDEAVSPTTDAEPVRCRRPHTSQTYQVGRVDNLVDGHLLAIDSQQVQDDVAGTCPDALGDAVGGSPDDLRLSVLRPVWFTPTLEQAAAGAAWYRCDVVVLADSESLLPVRGPLDGVLDTDEGRERFGMCGTAAPDAPDFERVPCGEDHTWRAFSVIDLPGQRFPGPQAVAEAGDGPCEDAAAAVADDPLDYEYAYEGPDADQWELGQRFVRCWAPD
ncbi:hypothetical protein GCM10023340_23650 [Nocardioides marinquilinus]|uniref:Septum formation-related domain-containing protein n=1 Tax=Nocardioides marinquilinus TaxID=1210400 RepID=A0ABP9PMA9_9ACTN